MNAGSFDVRTLQCDFRGSAALVGALRLQFQQSVSLREDSQLYGIHLATSLTVQVGTTSGAWIVSNRTSQFLQVESALPILITHQNTRLAGGGGVSPQTRDTWVTLRRCPLFVPSLTPISLYATAQVGAGNERVFALCSLFFRPMP